MICECGGSDSGGVLGVGHVLGWVSNLSTALQCGDGAVTITVIKVGQGHQHRNLSQSFFCLFTDSNSPAIAHWTKYIYTYEGRDLNCASAFLFACSPG